MDPKQKNTLLFGISIVLLIGSWLMFWPPATRITQGLDIRGGLSVILTAESTSTVTADDMERAELIVRNRVDRLGVRETTVQRQGNDSILVQIPGIKDAQQALDVLGSTGQLEFVEVSTIEDSAAVSALQSGQDGVRLTKGTYKPFMTGEVITQASVGQNSTTGKITVNLSMNQVGREKWAEVTTRLFPTQGQVAIVLDGIVKSAPSVQSAITDGQTEISGNFTAESGKQLKTVLETGALPVSLKFSESRVVGPTLGQDSLHKGVYAALIGLALVAIYVIVFYRGLGLLTVGSLVFFSSLFLGVLGALSKLGFFALTLPGIAGLVLTIGMAADSSILILERFKEEVNLGKTVRSAANSGSRHGIITSADADLVTFVSALVLYLVAIGPVKGFALTLMIGIACDIAVMLLFKRPSLMLLAESSLSKARGLWGVPAGVPAPTVKTKKGGAANA